MLSVVRSWLESARSSRSAGAFAQFSVIPDDGSATYIVGDIHGCKDELVDLLQRIDADAGASALPYRVVFVGDLIDRGPLSASVIDILCGRLSFKTIPLLGNHEAMFLQFFEDPHKHSSWLDFGGYETLMSYGLALDRANLDKLSLRRAKQTIEAHIPESHVRFFKTLKHGVHISLGEETFVVTHAGYDVEREVNAQSLETVLWGRRSGKASAPISIVHGHFIVEEVDLSGPIFNVDTGCYKSGLLSALKIAKGHPLSVITNKDELQC